MLRKRKTRTEVEAGMDAASASGEPNGTEESDEDALARKRALALRDAHGVEQTS